MIQKSYMYIISHISFLDYLSLVLNRSIDRSSSFFRVRDLTNVATRRFHRTEGRRREKEKAEKRPRERLRMQSTPITVWPCHARAIGNLARLDFHLDPPPGSTCDPTNPLARRIARLNFHEPESLGKIPIALEYLLEFWWFCLECEKLAMSCAVILQANLYLANEIGQVCTEIN